MFITNVLCLETQRLFTITIFASLINLNRFDVNGISCSHSGFTYSIQEFVNDICTCAPGYRESIITTSCIRCTDPNCLQCPSSVSNCTNCLEGFRLNEDGSCTCCTDPNCLLRPSSVSNCTNCIEGFRLNEDGSCTCEYEYNTGYPQGCTDPNCLICPSSVANCTNCLEGFRLNEDGSCTPCQQTNCSICSTPAICTVCMERFHLNTTTICFACQDPNCMTCPNQSFCTVCFNGYASNANGSCIDIANTSLRNGNIVRQANNVITTWNNKVGSSAPMCKGSYGRDFFAFVLLISVLALMK